jgi:hypothetical protein
MVRTVRTSRVVAGVALALTAGLVVAPSISQPASAGPVEAVQKVIADPSHGVYLVQDLGGGFYYEATTATKYVAKTASKIVFGNASGGHYVAVLQANGRDLLLVINGVTLQPLKEALGGS